MKTLHLPAALALLGLTLSAPATAQAPRLVIEAVHDGMGQKSNTFRPGDVVNLRGRGFHACKAPEGADLKVWRCAHEGLKVRVAGLPALVTETADDHLNFIVPQRVKPSKRVRVEVSVAGRGSASVTITVVEQSKAPVQSDGGVLQDEETRLLQSVGFTSFEHVPTPKGDSFVVKGYAKGFPDDLTVQLELSFDGQRVPNGLDQVTIHGEAFEKTFGAYAQKARAGRYQLDLLFELGKQSKRKTRQWVKTLSDKAREVYGGLRRRHTTVLGSKADVAKQQSQLQAYYQGFCKEVLALRDEVRGAVADAGRSLFVEGRAVNQERYVGWLVDLGFAKDAAAAQPIVEARKFARASGQLDQRAYGAWLEKTVQALDALAKRHHSWGAQFLVPLNPEADRLAQWLMAIVLGRLGEWSGKLYEHSQLKAPRVDVSVSLATPPEVTTRFFDAKRRELLKRVGLE